MLFVVKWLRGYLRIKVWGFSPERLFNLCAHKDILLWGIEKKQDSYELYISLSNFYQLKSFIRKTGCRVVILERYGLPFFWKYAKKRKLFIIGLFCAVAFWYASGAFVWDIQLEGNYSVSRDAMFRFLREEKIYVGVPKNKLQLNQLEKDIRKKFPCIIWTCAKVTGTKLEISVKENEYVYKETGKKDTDGVDLIAISDGIVQSIVVRQGVPKVKKGDEVKKDQILVEGKVPVYNEDQTIKCYQYVDADADIVLERSIEKNIKLNSVHVNKEYTGRIKTRKFIQIGEKRLFNPWDISYFTYDVLERKSTPVVLKKLGIQFSIGKTTYREYQNIEHLYQYEEAKEILAEKNSDFIKSLTEKGVQIIEKNVKIENGNNMWTLCGKYLVNDTRVKRANTDKTGDIYNNDEQ